MVLIFSIKGDYTTTIVCSWLKFFKKDFLRINGDENKVSFKKIDFESSQILIEVNDEIFNLQQFESIWYRKSGLGFKNFNSRYSIKDEEILLDEGNKLRELIKAENKTVIEFIHDELEKKKSIGRKFNADLNKLVVLKKANNLGIDIPKTYVLTNKTDLKELILKNNAVITKALDDNIYYFTSKRAYYTYTEVIDDKVINTLPDFFSPTLFQEMIDKKFEIRSFYLNDKFYSMAIFSQSDEQTKVDFRRYNNKKANRNVPFKLPFEIEEKLKKLYLELGLNTGSADLIYTKNGKYVFLEINPVGQFSMVSTPCNYYLEKEVAKFLSWE